MFCVVNVSCGLSLGAFILFVFVSIFFFVLVIIDLNSVRFGVFIIFSVVSFNVVSSLLNYFVLGFKFEKVFIVGFGYVLILVKLVKKIIEG